MDKRIWCSRCSKQFILNTSEQKFYENLGYELPKRCKPCRDIIKAEKKNSSNNGSEKTLSENIFVDTNPIVYFVNTIEEAKGFIKDPRLVFAHLVEEVGELSKKLWQMELKKVSPEAVTSELIDILFLLCYMADILHLDINEQIPERMEQIAKQYIKD